MPETGAFRNRIVEYGTKRADQFTGNPSNWRRHPKHQRAALNAVLEGVGWAGAIIESSRSGFLIDGHERLWQALEKGDDTPVPYLLVDLDPDEEKLILATYDPISAMAQTDADMLEGLLNDLRTSTIVQDDAALNTLLHQVAADANVAYGEHAGAEDAGADLDHADELQALWQTALGQCWEAGAHRIICGDSTDAATVDRLMDGDKAACMWTDPPYGVNYVGKTKDALTIQNDTAEGLPALLAGALGNANRALIAGAPFYVAHPAGAQQLQFLQAVVQVGWQIHEQLVWVKDSMVLGHSDYHYQHEPILYGWTPGNGRAGRGDHAGSHWYGNNAQVSVFAIPRPKRSEDHPTEKPVELVEAMLKNSTQTGELVYEPFSGSGTTIVACERLGRGCRAVELDPKFVAVALQRLKDMGLTPRLVDTWTES